MAGLDRVDLLRRRALGLLERARRACREGDYDVCAFEAEYAAHMYLESVLYRLLGGEPRGCSINGLLRVLAAVLLEAGEDGLARAVVDYSRSRRSELDELSRAHGMAVYGDREYTGEEAGRLLRAAEGLVSMLEELEGRLFQGLGARR